MIAFTYLNGQPGYYWRAYGKSLEEKYSSEKDSRNIQEGEHGHFSRDSKLKQKSDALK